MARKQIFVFLMAALLAIFSLQAAYAISANAAVNYISIQNNFLYPEEKYEQPNVKVSHGDSLYWVIPVTMNDELSTFFAVNESSGELSKDKGANRLIFRTAALLRNYNGMKKGISEKSGNWLVAAEYSKKFSGLSTMLQDETSDLTIIKTTINKSAVSSQISEMSSKLVSMSVLCGLVSNAINEALEFETEFSAQPKTTSYDELKEKLDAVFRKISELDSLAISYREDVSKLKQVISSEPSLSPDEKSLLIKTADPPAEFSNIGVYATTAIQLQSATDAIYANLQKNMDAYLNEFEERVKRNNAYMLLYGENATLKSKTDGRLLSLKAARDYIIDKDRVDGWKEKEAVSRMSSYWDLAKNYFETRNYDKAKEYGEKALKEAVIIYEGGIAEMETEPLLSNETITKIIIILVALLIGLLIWNNRNKIMSSLGGGANNKEELEL